MLKALSGSVEDPLLSVQRDTSQSSTSTSALPGPSTSLAGVRQLVPRPRRLYKRRRPSQLVPRPMASSSRSSRAAMLSMIEREGAGETALHKATRLAYEVRRAQRTSYIHASYMQLAATSIARLLSKFLQLFCCVVASKETETRCQSNTQYGSLHVVVLLVGKECLIDSLWPACTL